MVGSLLLSRVTNSYFDKTDGGISDANHAASQICQAVQQMSQSNMNTLNALREQAENQAKDQTAFYRTVGDILTSLQTSYRNTENAINSMVILARSQEVALNDLRNKARKCYSISGYSRRKLHLSNCCTHKYPTTNERIIKH